MAAWDSNGVQISGSDSRIEIGEIKSNFNKKIAKYSETRPRIVLIEGLEKENSESLLIFVYYQFFLIRYEDNMPVLEEAHEVYRLQKIDTKWKITYNYDHFSPIKK